MTKLDYIAELGVNTIWLLPFYPSPRLDDGYDIAEYRAVHPDYGTMADVKRFIAAAHARGLRVITELVINHTSDQHPWFQRARKAKPGSPARNFYVWSDTDQKYAGTRIIFLDTEQSNWTWDPVAGAYYWHRFYSHQPDLNFDNPQVLEAVLGVMRFWLDLGVDGLRLDAVPYLIEREGTNNENLPETHDVLRRIRAELDKSYPGRMLLAEANQWPEDTKDYFGQGDECHMAFHFPLMPRMYMAIAREDRFPITDIMRQTPEIPENCQWAIFLRNHDELTLEMVTDSERDYLWETYAADRRARINLGIRRRLAPLLERDRRRIELMNCLLLSMPGTPVIYYGDEIGMGDNIHLGDRDGVRTPMQWSPDRNGGFSRADPAALVLPTLMDPLYGYETVNVEAQLRDRHSLLHWMRRMLAIRRRHRGVRPRHAALPLSEEPQGAGLPARARRRDHPVRRERLARAAGGRARSVRARRPRAGRVERRLAVPADRPAHLPAHAAALRLLLVPARGAERAARLAHSRARADARVHHAGDAQQDRGRAHVRRRRRVRARRAAVLSHEAALVLRQGPDASSRRASSISRRCRTATAKCCSPRSRPRRTAKPAAGSCRCRSRWDDEPARRAAEPACARARAARAGAPGC